MKKLGHVGRSRCKLLVVYHHPLVVVAGYKNVTQRKNEISPFYMSDLIINMWYIYIEICTIYCKSTIISFTAG